MRRDEVERLGRQMTGLAHALETLRPIEGNPAFRGAQLVDCELVHALVCSIALKEFSSDSIYTFLDM